MKNPVSRLTMWLLCAALLSISSLQAQNGYYHLIAGSFDDFASARQLVVGLEQQNYEAVLLFPNAASDRYRVSVYQSVDRQAVSQYQQQLKRQGKGKAYWILAMTPQKAAAADPGANRRTRSEEMPSDGTGNVYHLIVGSYDNMRAAEDAVQALQTQGYEPYVLMPGQTSNYRVSIYRSMDREEISTYSSMLRKRGKKEGWIYEEEPGTVTTFGQPYSFSSAAAGTPMAPGTEGSRMAPGTEGNRMMQASGQGATFHLIAGSFERFDQASEFADAMRAKGYNPLIMLPETGISQTFRVSVYQSTQRPRVERFQQQLAAQGTKGWIYAQP